MLTKMFKMMKKGNKGFTLVELMVVVVIIGVLTAIAVPVYNNASQKAKINAIAANLRIINGAISQYKTTTGNYPTFAVTDKVVTTNLVPDYIQAWPDNNPKGVTYQIENTDGVIQGTASLSSEIGDLSGSSNTLATVQAQIAE